MLYTMKPDGTDMVQLAHPSLSATQSEVQSNSATPYPEMRETGRLTCDGMHSPTRRSCYHILEDAFCAIATVICRDSKGLVVSTVTITSPLRK
jgi:hypothetical protein